MIGLILLLLRLYQIVIVVRVFISWIHPDPYNPIVQWVIRITDPVFAPFRRMLRMERIGIDLSPLIVLLIIELLERMVYRIF
jgi:YggT family protein